MSILTKQQSIDAINHTHDSLKLLFRIARHDLKNIYEELEFHTQRLSATKSSPKDIINYMEHYDRLMCNMKESLCLLSETTEVANINLVKLLIPILYHTSTIEYCEILFERIEMRTNIRVLTSIITNVLNNSKEAYLRNYQSLDGFKITIDYTEALGLIIDDNSGGFDVDNIMLGNSTKVNPSGHFLDTMVNNCQILGFDFVINKIDNGTQIRINPTFP